VAGGAQPAATDLGARIQTEVQRAILRGIKGVEYLTSPAPAVGPTPKDVLLSQGPMTLYRYRPLTDEVYRVPVLIVMATTNRGYILDLAPGQSFVEFMLRHGYDVYMLDWNPPRPEDKALRIEDYALRFVGDSIRAVQDDSGETDVTLVGYCFGGVLSTLYAAAHPDGPIRNLVCFTTPIDFRELRLFHNFTDQRYFDVDRLVDSLGNVPPEAIVGSFDMLRPASRAVGQVQLWANIWNDEYVKSYRMMERWGNDTLPLAGEYFRQTVKDLFWHNKLFEDRMELDGRRLSLTDIRIPLFHAIAEHDHIVPYEAAKPLIQRVASHDKEEVVLKGGHVSLVAGANAVKRLWPRLDIWLSKRSI
jgi:polyhydroxyalkanoate synthase